MRKFVRIGVIAGALAAAVLPSTAQVLDRSAPPSNALKLSEIVSRVENREGFRFVDDVEWDRDGYYEVTYYTVDNAKVEIKIDPVTGEPRR